MRMRLMLTGPCAELLCGWSGEGRVYDYRAGRASRACGDVALGVVFFGMSCLSRGEGKKKKGRAGVAHARTVSSIVVVESKKEEISDPEPLIDEEQTKKKEESTREEGSALVGGETPMLNFPTSIMNATTTGTASMSTFYISLTSEGRRAMAGDAARGVEPMPAFFLAQPCEESFAQAYEFFGRPGIPAAQRGVAKRWILEHLRDIEYALQSVEWERFPLARRYYQRIVGPDTGAEEEEGGKRGRVMKSGEMIDVSAEEMGGMRVSTPPPPPLVIHGAAAGRRAVRFDDADEDADGDGDEEGFERL